MSTPRWPRAALAKGSLVIRDHATWYSESQRLKGNQVLDIWLEEERAALGAGYSGLRITGNTSFLTKEDWPVFMEYEELVDKAFAGRRIVTLCSYLLAQLGASEILDVARRHGRTLERPDESWQLAAARFI
jgi:hypothetical protein